MNLKWGLGETNLLMYSVVDKILQEAMAFYKTGQIDETERICQEILHSDPDSIDALHLLGVVAYQVGRYDVEVDGQWLTFPFPFVHHQPLHIF